MVERSIAWFTRNNRKVRYRGVAKNDHWLHHRAAALNLRRLITMGLNHTGTTWAIAQYHLHPGVLHLPAATRGAPPQHHVIQQAPSVAGWLQGDYVAVSHTADGRGQPYTFEGTVM